MPRGGARPGAGRPRTKTPPGEKYKRPSRAKPKPPPVPDAAGLMLGAEVVKAHSPTGKKEVGAPTDWPFGTVPPGLSPPPLAAPPDPIDDGIDPATGLEIDPKIEPAVLLQRIAQNPRVDLRSRIQAATNAAPYFHAKKGEAKKGGKDGASKPANPYTAGQPPLRAVK